MLTVVTRPTDYDIMLALLRIYSRATRSLHIGNIVGAEYRSSDLEKELNLEFTPEERAQAMRCARELMDSALVIPTYSDLVNPEEWRIIRRRQRCLGSWYARRARQGLVGLVA